MDARVPPPPPPLPMDGSMPDGEVPSMEDGGVPDAGDLCGACVARDICHDAVCDPLSGACAQVPKTDGTLCGEGTAEICVFGSCVPRGCGDGYREPGPDPMREGCDDRNGFFGDLCSPSCETTLNFVDRDESTAYEAFPSRAAPAVGVDGEGRALLVWRRVYGHGEEIWARRYDRFGAPEGELVLEDGDGGVTPIDLGADGGPAIDLDGGSLTVDPEDLLVDDDLNTPSNARPTVAGLAGGGWVVAWAAPALGGMDIAYAMVGPDGSIGGRQRANQITFGVQSEVRIAPVGEGFVLVWVNEEDTEDDEDGGLRYRLFSSSGQPSGFEQILPTTTEGKQEQPTVASQGEAWMAAWVHTPKGGGDERIRGRRFFGASPLDLIDHALRDETMEAPSAAALGEGDYAIAYRTYQNDAFGDVAYGRWESDATVLSAITPVVETEDFTEGLPQLAVAPTGGLVIAFEKDSPAEVAFAVSAGATPGSAERTLLEERIALLSNSALTVASSPRGVFFAYEGAAPNLSGGAVTLFLLPFD